MAGEADEAYDLVVAVEDDGADVWVRLHRAPDPIRARRWASLHLAEVGDVRWRDDYSAVVHVRPDE